MDIINEVFVVEPVNPVVNQIEDNILPLCQAQFSSQDNMVINHQNQELGQHHDDDHFQNKNYSNYMNVLPSRDIMNNFITINGDLIVEHKNEIIFQDSLNTQYDKLRNLIKNRDSRKIMEYLQIISSVKKLQKSNAKGPDETIDFCFDDYALFKEAIRCLDKTLFDFLLLKTKKIDLLHYANIIVRVNSNNIPKKRCTKHNLKRKVFLKSLFDKIFSNAKRNESNSISTKSIIQFDPKYLFDTFDYRTLFDVIDYDNESNNSNNLNKVIVLKKSLIKCILSWCIGQHYVSPDIKISNNLEVPNKKNVRPETITIVTDFIVKNNLLLTANSQSENITIINDCVYELINMYYLVHNEPKLIISIFENVSISLYVALMRNICSKILTSSQHANIAKVSDPIRILHFLTDDMIDSSYRKYYANEMCKNENVFRYLVYEEKFIELMRTSLQGVTQIFINNIYNFPMCDEIEYFYYTYGKKFQIDTSSLFRLALKGLLSCNYDCSKQFIIDNILICLKIAPYMPLVAEGFSILVNTVGPQLKYFGLHYSELNQNVNKNYQRSPQDQSLMYLPITIIDVLVKNVNKFYMELFKILTCGFKEIDSNNYYDCLNKSYNYGNIIMFEYLLDYPLTTSFDHKNIMSLLTSISNKLFKKKNYKLLIKIFDLDINISLKIDIINNAFNNQEFDLFKSLVEKCPNLPQSYYKSLVVNLINYSHFDIAESLIVRRDATSTNFYDFDDSVVTKINTSNSNFLKEYVVKADEMKKTILRPLLNFEVKINDILKVSYDLIENNLSADKIVCDDECIICYENYKKTDTMIVLKCGHYLHECCYAALQVKLCPNCDIY